VGVPCRTTQSGSTKFAPYAWLRTTGDTYTHFYIPQLLLSMPSYWSLFPEFDHDPNAPIKDEFDRLAKLKRWMGKKKKEKRREEWAKCFSSEFETHYGKDASSLAGWQSLCSEVGLDDIPESVQGCRSVSYSPSKFHAVMSFMLNNLGRP
jgi:hypothetical protein